MNRNVIMLALMTALFSLQAMYSDDYLNDVCADAPFIKMTGAVVTKSTEPDGSVIFKAVLLANNRIEIKQEHIGLERQYGGHHYFRSKQGGSRCEDIDALEAKKLFEQCNNLLTQQVTKTTRKKR